MTDPSRRGAGAAGSLAGPSPVALLGVPFDKVTTAEALQCIGRMIQSDRPHYAATANVDFVVQALGDVELRRILTDADLVLCDGMPLVWASRILGDALPERVAGSDLVPELLAEAERRGWRVFFLGGSPESLARAADNVRRTHPELQLVGTYSPPFGPLLEMDQDDIVKRIRAARPHILLVAFGCPKQEKWINMHFRQLGVPFSIGVGATIDFLGGTVRRAPKWMQQSGLEWVFRLLQEPRRLFRRYVTDFWVFGWAILRQSWAFRAWHRGVPVPGRIGRPSADRDALEWIDMGERLDAVTVRGHDRLWADLAGSGGPLLLDLSRIEFIDSTGVGHLVRLNKQLRGRGRPLVLVAPSKPVRNALALMRLEEVFCIAADPEAARNAVRDREGDGEVRVAVGSGGVVESLEWCGDVTAANWEGVWRLTRPHLDDPRAVQAGLVISLARVRFVDSTGVRLMVRARREAQQRGVRIRFTGAGPTVVNVLRILRLDQLLLG